MARKSQETPECCFGCRFADDPLTENEVWSLVQGKLCLVYNSWDLDQAPACADHLVAGSAARVRGKVGKGTDVAPGASRHSYGRRITE